MSKATIRDVAAAAGVSISAVSYILNGSDKKKYSDSTVKTVRRAAEKLHYVPNRIARGMRSGKANAIGVITSFETGGETFAPTMRALTRAASQIGSSLVIPGGCENLTYTEAFHNHTVDGFVLFVSNTSEFNERAHIRALKESGAPFVVLNGSLRFEGVPSVFYDYYAASQAAVSHLLSLGRCRIAYMDSFDEDSAWELRNRREGYVDTIREAGFLPRVYDLEHFSKEELLSADAVVTSSARTARALIRNFLDAGLRVPQTLDVLAGNGEDRPRDASLPLTAVDFPFEETAEFAIRTLSGLASPTVFTPTPFVRDGKTVKK